MLFGSNSSSAPRSDLASSAWARSSRSERSLPKSIRCSQSTPMVAPREAMLVIGVFLSPSAATRRVPCALPGIVNQIEHPRQSTIKLDERTERPKKELPGEDRSHQLGVLEPWFQLARLDPSRELDQHLVDRRVGAQFLLFADDQAAHLLALAFAALEPVLQDRHLGVLQRPAGQHGVEQGGRVALRRQVVD